jgi:hypothetical protein
VSDVRGVLQEIIDTARLSDSVTGETAVAFLAAAGFKVLGREPTEEMMRAYYTCMEGSHPTAKMNPNKYLTHNLKARKRWSAMFDAAPPQASRGEGG